MKDIYNKYFYMEKDKKMTEAVFKTRITMLILAIAACVAVIASSAFALFSHDIKHTTQLKAATWQVNEHLTEKEGDKHIYEIYGTSGVTGYCIITVKDAQGIPTIYYTRPFKGSMKLTIIAAEGSSIEFDSHWGRPESFGITEDLIHHKGVIVHSYTPEPESEEELEEEGSTPSDDAPSGDESSSPSEDTPSGVEDSSPSEDTPSGVEDSSPSEDTPSGVEDSSPSEDTPSGVEDSSPSDDAPSSDESSDSGKSESSSSSPGGENSGSDSSAPSGGESAGSGSTPPSSSSSDGGE